MLSKRLILKAEKDPVPGVKNPTPNQIYKHPSLEIVSCELGPIPAGCIRVEMIYAGICGTDVHIVESDPKTGYIKTTAPAMIPEQGRVIGHEGVGRVVALGENVGHIQPGDVVTFESILVCHLCAMCRKGRFNQCLQASLLGLEEDGLFGQVVDVPASLAHVVTELVDGDEDLQAMACVEPAGVAYVACQNGHVAGGDTVVIFGAGPIGLLTAILAQRVFGASEVYVIEPVKFRRKFAELWCDRVYDVSDPLLDLLPGVDVLIEASGVLDNVHHLFCKLNPNGRVVLLARSGASLVIDRVDHMITNAISIVGSRGHLCGAFVDILHLYKKGRIPLNEIVTSVLPDLEALKGLLASPEQILEENCKVLVQLSSR